MVVMRLVIIIMVLVQAHPISLLVWLIFELALQKVQVHSLPMELVMVQAK